MNVCARATAYEMCLELGLMKQTEITKNGSSRLAQNGAFDQKHQIENLY
jgi:hypothetical protein